MPKSRKLSQLQKRRDRTLKVCFPHVIKDKKEIEDLFVGIYCVKLPRQSSRSCHVVFSNAEEKVKNYKLAKNKTVDGKHILIESLHDLTREKETTQVKKVKRKKIFMPKIEPDVKVTQSIFIGNIAVGTKSDEIKAVLPGCISVTLLKPYNSDFRGAIVKMEDIQIAAEYLKKERKWPMLNGHTLCMKVDTRARHKKRKKVSSAMKIYNGDITQSSKKSKSPDCIENNNESN